MQTELPSQRRLGRAPHRLRHPFQLHRLRHPSRPPHRLRQVRRGLIAAVALALSVAACGGNSASPGGGSSGSSGVGELAEGAPIKLGVLTSLTGHSASAFVTVEAGVKARLALANATGGINGHKLNYEMVDDESSPQGASRAVRKVISNNDFGLLSVSAEFSGAVADTKTAGLPVTGAAFDGSEAWFDPTYTNLFSATGYPDPNLVATTFGKFFKARGATKLAAVGGGSTVSIGSVLGAQKSALRAGLKVGYRTTSLVPGTVDVAAAVRGIKESGADALYMSVAPNTGFALIIGLKRAGVKLKSALLPTGYGGELLQSPQAVAAAQGVEFSTIPAPVELNTSATKAFAAAVAKYGGSSEASSFGTYMGWITADLFIHGLVKTGPIVSRDGFIQALHSTSWSGGGLEEVTDFSDARAGAFGLGPGNCIYVVRLLGKQFQSVPGAAPICGSVIPRVKTGIEAQ
jgi:ABC-type branched-subunit amino acid transport system substrate-binding protein